MQRFCLIVLLALESGCSSYRVRCDSHLRPINPSRKAAKISQTPADTAQGIQAPTGSGVLGRQ